MNDRRHYPLTAYIVLLGATACLGWLYAGQIDDAPGAGLIGIVAMFSSFFVAYRLAKRRLDQSSA